MMSRGSSGISSSRLDRPQDLSLSDVHGIDIIIHVDNRIVLTHTVLLAIRFGAIALMQSLFTAQEVTAFSDNCMWWNVAYAHTKLGSIPEDFAVRNGKIFIHYFPSEAETHAVA
jgi:hypothetical protein